MDRRHLVIAHQPGWSALDDWRRIAATLCERAPDVRVYIVDNTAANALLREVAARAPTLVFSPGPLQVFRPARGRVEAGRRVPKAEQLARLDAAGVPVPKWTLLGQDESFDATGWTGPVVVKPADGLSSTGVGVKVFNASEIAGVAAARLAPGNKQSTGQIIVQAFVDTGPALEYWRVLTLFGRPLYCLRTTLRQPLEVTAEGVPVNDAAIANNAYGRDLKHMDLVADPDVLALAADCRRAVPECPLHGVDILRRRTTGRCYVLELNPGGNTWHFSSDHSRARGRDPAFEAAKRDQFGAFDIAADVLIERTRAAAI